jgi:hypothetical protein
MSRGVPLRREWTPPYSDLGAILAAAWRWHNKRFSQQWPTVEFIDENGSGMGVRLRMGQRAKLSK